MTMRIIIITFSIKAGKMSAKGFGAFGVSGFLHVFVFLKWISQSSNMLIQLALFSFHRIVKYCFHCRSNEFLFTRIQTLTKQ